MSRKKSKIIYHDVDFEIFPNKYKRILERLSNTDRTLRLETRKELEEIGVEIIPHLSEILYFDDHKLRLEAAKTLGQMAYPEGINIQIQALEDEESDIRWIAAEGLVKLGRKVIKPLLEKLIDDDGESICMRKGAFHIFPKLDIRDERKEKLKPLIKALNTKKLYQEIPIIAKSILEEMDD